MKKVIEIMFFCFAGVLLVLLIDNKFLTYKSYIYDVDGVKIKVTLYKKDGYMINADDFKITKVSKGVSEYTFGDFLTNETYEDIIYLVDNGTYEKLFTGESDTYDYTFYKDAESYNYVIKFKDKDAIIILKNGTSVESARECFDRLSFEIVE